jgi:hypothetical protein
MYLGIYNWQGQIMSALHAVCIVLEVVAVRANGACDFRQGDGAVPVNDNGVLPFWLEERANHIHTCEGSVVAVPVRPRFYGEHREPSDAPASRLQAADDRG